ncbi:acyl carrier protein [Streptomyces hiroshimensis]|uniref:Acyl carrier protein n=1 Tax=Streptomyces hiroshimensis TaxID=66424 RepID=A0ABQ2Z739_9ACTN|nr:acyl carrier protein [Streptomyces hiroshimensis]GGY05468.1 hypothetical protein GCM10010324_60280 [Streptomyces hiroshimensis]
MTDKTLSIDAYTRLLRDEIGLDVPADRLASDFDELPAWDSLYLLKLVTALELATGRRLAVDKLLQTRSLQEIHTLAVGG